MSSQSDTAFVGFVEKGSALVVPILISDSNDSPVNADSHPTGVTFDVYAADMSSILLSSQTATNLSAEEGVYFINTTIDTGFAKGSMYSIVIKFLVSTVTKRKLYTFIVT